MKVPNSKLIMERRSRIRFARGDPFSNDPIKELCIIEKAWEMNRAALPIIFQSMLGLNISWAQAGVSIIQLFCMALPTRSVKEPWQATTQHESQRKQKGT